MTLHHALAERSWPEWTHRSLHIQNPFAIGAFTLVELVAGLVTRRMSNPEVVAQRPGISVDCHC
jgi:hypothetical protein